jgi:hypothetical protein
MAKVATAKVTLYQGEAQSLPFRIKDKATGLWLNLTGATYSLWVKRSPEDADPLFVKVDADFGTSGEASGYLTVFLSTSDTWQEPWTYTAELRIVRAGSPSPVMKLRFDLEILKAIGPSDFTLVPVGIPSQGAIGAPTIIQL